MTPQIIQLCRLYHTDEKFRNDLESNINLLTKNLIEHQDLLFMDRFFVYTEKTKDLCRSSNVFPCVEFYYQIRYKCERYPECGYFTVESSDGGNINE